MTEERVDGSSGPQIEPVDERDSRWEDRWPRFRVYVFEESGRRVQEDGTLGPGYSTATYDITGGDVLDAIAWAQAAAAAVDGLYSVALVADGYERHAHRGLVWLVGMDYQDTPDEVTRPVLERMRRRRGRTLVEPD